MEDKKLTVNPAVDVSVVIGFKDWGTERLLLSVKSLMKSFGKLVGEVIVSDYGSRLPSTLEDQVNQLGARYVYTATDGVWSRSRALNAGFAVSTGRVLVSTDADMLFTPRSMEIIGSRILSGKNEGLVLQCRDLPPEFDSEGVQKQIDNWLAFDEASTLRPRWGMGGMMAVDRNTYLLLRGFDERMEIYGGEDMDFAERVRRAGRRIGWVESPEVRMYHMWHPPTRQLTVDTEEGREAIRFNREIVLNDKSYIRNLHEWKHRPDDALPLATVVISTKNRADYLSDSINSVLAQSVQDFELLIIDDGSEDNTRAVVESFGDARIQYYYRKSAGLASARNFAVTKTSARYTIIHDDDDMMFPWRIESHFLALEGGVTGTYGGWIDFQNHDGSSITTNPGKEFGLQPLLFSSKVYAHATLMIETQILRSIRYDEKLRSGSDYNLGIRLARSGVVLRHSGQYHLVRRMHDRQVTELDARVQKSSARFSSTLGLLNIRPGKQKVLRKQYSEHPKLFARGEDNPLALVTPYLPDHLVHRTVIIHDQNEGIIPESIVKSSRYSTQTLIDVNTKQVVTSDGLLSHATWEDLAKLARAGRRISIEATISESENEVGLADSLTSSHLIEEVSGLLTENDLPYIIIEGCDLGEYIGDHTVLVWLRSVQANSTMEAAAIPVTGVGGLRLFVESIRISDAKIRIHHYQSGVEAGSREFWTETIGASS